MEKDNSKMLLTAQQGELNAVLMYKEFEKITKDAELKKIFSQAAADEGRHASLLKKYTNQALEPKAAQAKLLGIAYRLLPKKLIYFAIYKGECAGGDSYKPYINDYPEFEDMMNDEYHHAQIFKDLM